MVMVLPDELWEKVADFLRSPSLSHVCKRLFFLLGCRHVTVRNGFATVLRERLAFLLERKDTVHTLTVNYPDSLLHRSPGYLNTDVVPHIIGDVLQFPNLRSLTLDLSCWHVTRAHLAKLSQMRFNPCLQSLRLTLNAAELGNREVEALASFKEASTLEILELQLKGNLNVSESGARALTAFKDMPALTSFHLSLQSTGIGTAGAEALAALKDNPKLRVLTLGLEYCTIGIAGFRALSELRLATSLHTLTLRVTGTGITADGIRALTALSSSHSLRKLIIYLSTNHCGPECGRSLALLAQAPRLEVVQLQLAENSLGDEGASALSAFTDTASVTALTLDLSHNSIGNAGALALSKLAYSTTLQTLHLSLLHNRVTDMGFRALRLLELAPFSCRLVR